MKSYLQIEEMVNIISSRKISFDKFRFNKLFNLLKYYHPIKLCLKTMIVLIIFRLKHCPFLPFFFVNIKLSDIREQTSSERDRPCCLIVVRMFILFFILKLEAFHRENAYVTFLVIELLFY